VNLLTGLACLASIWGSPALASDTPELAILPLDAVPDTEQAALDRTVRGVTSALQSEGGVIVVYDTDLATRLGSKAEDALASARDALSEGRRLLQEGDADLAIAFLQQAVDAHEEAGSEVIRRGEAADAHYSLGRALLTTYDRDRARTEFRRAIVLVPDYMATRADAVNGDIQALADEATAALTGRPPRKRSAEEGATLATKLQVTCVVHGTVDAEGDLSLSVQNGASVRYVVERPGPFEPPAVGDPWYADIAAQTIAACRGEAVPTWTPPVAEVDPIDPDPIPKPTTRKRTAVTASVLSVLVLGAAGAGAAWYVLPEGGAAAPPTWNLTITLP
jgi:hypothetical protein